MEYFKKSKFFFKNMIYMNRREGRKKKYIEKTNKFFEFYLLFFGYFTYTYYIQYNKKYIKINILN